MREILFQGKRLDNGEWVYGDLSCHKDGRMAIRWWYVGAYRVDWVAPSTVGQYTGWDDCNGQKIFEGNVVKISVPVHGCKPMEEMSEVYFDDGCFCVNWGGNSRSHNRTRIDSFIPETQFTVVGNIYDNPELLEQ